MLYEVTVGRWEYVQATLLVPAANMKQAKEIALEDVKDDDFEYDNKMVVDKIESCTKAK